MPPILEEDLVGGAAHLFSLEKSGEIVMFVVYKRLGGTQSADALLSSSAGVFTEADYAVRDAPEDTHTVSGGALSTSHRITVGGRTDGYVATLAGRFDRPGDVLVYDFVTPALANPGDVPFSSIQVFTGVDGAGEPVWVEVDGGPFPAFGAGRVEITRLAAVPALGPLGLAALGFLLACAALARLAPGRR